MYSTTVSGIGRYSHKKVTYKLNRGQRRPDAVLVADSANIPMPRRPPGAAAAGLEAADVGGNLGRELKDGRPPRDMRHDRDFGVQPQRAFRRQWLGPKRVQCGVGELARVER